MESPRRVGIRNGGCGGYYEENLMAILDPSGVKQATDIHDDRLSFLEAVRTSSLGPESPIAPSWNISHAIFQIFVDSTSLELAMKSFQLLIDLEKRYPRVYLLDPGTSGSSSCVARELVVVREAWSPFKVVTETHRGDPDGTLRNTENLIDASRFVTLIERIVQSVSEAESQLVIKTIEDMLLLQYLVNVIEADFFPRQTSYTETSNWVLLRESLLNMFMGSRKLNFKNLVKDWMLILSKKCRHHNGFQHFNSEENSSAKAQDSEVALTIAVAEIEKQTCNAVQKLLTLIMELDLIRKEADLLGLTSRADGLRIPLLETIVDELTYNKAFISPFLMMFSEPRWKLMLIMQYFSKYYSKPSVRTRSWTDSSNDTTFEGILSGFSNLSSIKPTIKRVTPEVAQLLLAHAFQAYLSLQQSQKLTANFSEKIGSMTLPQTCNKLISAFKNIKKIDEDSKCTSFEKEALFTAATILLRK